MKTPMKKSEVVDLFQALKSYDIWDVTTQRNAHEEGPHVILIHFSAPDGDGTHYALRLNLDRAHWELINFDQDETVVFHRGRDQRLNHYD